LARFFGNFFSEKKLHKHVLALKNNPRAIAVELAYDCARQWVEAGHAPTETLLLFYGTFGLTPDNAVGAGQKYPKSQENIWRTLPDRQAGFTQATP